MPPLPSVSKVIRFDLRQSFGGNTRILDHLFLRYSGTLSQTDLATVLATMSAAWAAQMSSQMSVNHSLTSIQGTDLTSNLGAQAVNSSAHAGTQAGTDLPCAVALVVEFKIARRFRGGHPRIYLTGQQAGRTATPKTWSAAVISGVATNFAAFIAAACATPPAAVGTLTHTTVHYFAGFTNKTFPSGRSRAVPVVLATPTFDDVVGYVVNPIIASQRRRNQQSL